MRGGQELSPAERAEACIIVQEIVKFDPRGSFVDAMIYAIENLKKSDPESLEAKFLQTIFLTKCFGFIQSPQSARGAFAEAGKEIPPFLLAYVLAAEKTIEQCSERTNSRAGTVQKSDPVEVAECEWLLKLAAPGGAGDGTRPFRRFGSDQPDVAAR